MRTPHPRPPGRPLRAAMAVALLGALGRPAAARARTPGAVPPGTAADPSGARDLGRETLPARDGWAAEDVLRGGGAGRVR